MAWYAAISFTSALASELRSAGHRHRSESQTLAPETRLGTTSVSCGGCSSGPAPGIIDRETTSQHHQEAPQPEGRGGRNDLLSPQQQAISYANAIFLFAYPFLGYFNLYILIAYFACLLLLCLFKRRPAIFCSSFLVNSTRGFSTGWSVF